MYEVLLTVFLTVAIILIVLIMLQQGKGTDIGGSLGANVSNILFGSSNSNSFMTRITIIMAVLFFIISLALDNINSNKINKDNQQEKISKPLNNK